MKKTVRTIEITWNETTSIRVEHRRGVAKEEQSAARRSSRHEDQGETGEKPEERLEISK